MSTGNQPPAALRAPVAEAQRKSVDDAPVTVDMLRKALREELRP